MTIYISTRTKDGIPLFEQLLAEAIAADGRDGHFEVRIDAVDNTTGRGVELVFNNDDMERDEMNGRIVVDAEA